MFAFFKNLHINLSVAIEKRKNFDATIDRETIFVQNIDFRDVAIDKNSDENFEKVTNDSTTNFDDAQNNEMIDRNNEKDENIDCFETNFDFEICAKNETIDFDFFTCRMRICSCNLMLLSNLFLQRLHVYLFARFLIKRIFFLFCQLFHFLFEFVFDFHFMFS